MVSCIGINKYTGDIMTEIKENINRIRSLIKNSEELMKSATNVQDGINFLVKYISSNLKLYGFKIFKFYKNQSFYKIYSSWESENENVYGEQRSFFSSSGNESWLKDLNEGKIYKSFDDLFRLDEKINDKCTYILIPLNDKGCCRGFFQLKCPLGDIYKNNCDDMIGLLKDFASIVDSYFMKGIPDLKLRMNTLDCLYNISRIMNYEDLSYEETLQIICEIIPSGMSYSQETHVLLSMEGKNYASLYFGESENSLSREICYRTNKIGFLQIYRSALLDDYRENAFTDDEKNFITTVVELISTFISKYKSELNLLKNNMSLENKIELRTSELVETNTLLKNEIEKHISIKKQLDDLLEKNKKNESFRLEFLRSLSHEIKTPLNIISGNSQLIEKGIYGDPSDFKEPLKGINDAVNKATKLVNNLLIMSNSDFNNMSFNKKLISFFHFKEILDEYEFMAQKKDIGFEVKLIGNSTFYGDLTIWRTILSNILSNAVKYTTLGRIEVSFEVDMQKIVLRVKDTGKGISQSEMKCLFEIKGIRKNGIPYGGFGLPVVKKMVEFLNGKIDIHTSSEGTEFIIVVPVE